MTVLTIVETVKIQGYIFGSNKLRENIGASYLVEQATREWVYEIIQEIASSHNIIKDNEKDSYSKYQIDDSRFIEKDNLAAEVIYTGAGNASILFSSLGTARNFAETLSRKVIQEAPGIRLAIAHSDIFDWSKNNLKEQVSKLADGKLAKKKRELTQSLPIGQGWGVTAECSSTGLGSSYVNKADRKLISKDIKKKLAEVKNAKERLHKMLYKHDKEEELKKLTFTDDLDNLSRSSGEESYIAVVHIDGNSIGERLKQETSKANSNREYIEKMRDFSRGIEGAAIKALYNTFRYLQKQIKEGWFLTEVLSDKESKTKPKEIYLKKDDESKQPFWPIRPIVFGGDDVTFVCNGQLGLSLAAIYINEFEKTTGSWLGYHVYSCAGVAIVKVHYPFQRAYSLSEALIKKAKESLGSDKQKVSAIDWHFSSTGLSGNLENIRETEYSLSNERSLIMRPVRFSQKSDWNNWRTWHNFNQIVSLFNYKEDWANRRNKLKALREALRKGSDAVREFRRTFLEGKELPTLKDAPFNVAQDGWDGNICGYFDMLEALDHHFILEGYL